jgi:hypothetical protein
MLQFSFGWCGRMRFDQLKRRELITLLGGAATWPLAARARQPGGMPRIGLLSSFAENDPEAQAWIRELMQGLQELGWVNGRNVQIEFRFAAGDPARISTLATELIELRPDMLFAVGPIPAAALRQQTGAPVALGRTRRRERGMPAAKVQRKLPLASIRNATPRAEPQAGQAPMGPGTICVAA